MTAPASAHVPSLGLGLGLDAGGTQTRWALAEAGGRLVAEGHVGGFSGLMLNDATGRIALAQITHQLAAAVLPHGRPLRVVAGITGVSDKPQARQMEDLLSQALGLAPSSIRCGGDMDIAYRAAFAPGEGYLLYAGTGSIAAFVDAGGQLQRAGGRGGLLGDEGSGYWIARQALALVWRGEDEAPGAWQQSKLARALFDAIGGSDWSVSRAFIYGAERGAIGRLALAVAAAAREGDEQAQALLLKAGHELARLVLALIKRYGAKPVAAAGRALQLHPLIAQGLGEALPQGLELRLVHLEPHKSAAIRAAENPAAS
ncbi:BadF/BadG/BcrA/BcrD ATPase family protein [Pelomonas sp. SE-A7]|uniref:BadF/BadG/BcrA/BcrD ATPase family protein n=1 Tax=Pelomonas sp. SE-A7 TaxID=3054953 RepID=UPI00259CDDEA|nr:BadF/BadG/BcrA/BcrD ATPase family protein [Pelomonas sp. SE-A7]MDM4768165.1 BadF/BadG/BcrA/BcrD ATPase family protein [Pelomonas sp. SE-A7]